MGTRIVVSLMASMLLSACASHQESRPQNWALAVQTAESREAHEQLASHYEETARRMDADAAEQRAMLQQYRASPFRYSEWLYDMKARSAAMIRDLEMAAAESRKMAQYHRQMAAEQAH
jgi:hypothetical protein